MTYDPVSRVLSSAEALSLLAGLLPPEQHGLALLLALVADDLKKNGEVLSDHIEPSAFLEPSGASQ